MEDSNMPIKYIKFKVICQPNLKNDFATADIHVKTASVKRHTTLEENVVIELSISGEK